MDVEQYSVFLGVEAEMLFHPVEAHFDSVETSAVMIDGHRECMNIFAHADEFCLTPFKACARTPIWARVFSSRAATSARISRLRQG